MGKDRGGIGATINGILQGMAILGGIVSGVTDGFGLKDRIPMEFWDRFLGYFAGATSVGRLILGTLLLWYMARELRKRWLNWPGEFAQEYPVAEHIQFRCELRIVGGHLHLYTFMRSYYPNVVVAHIPGQYTVSLQGQAPGVGRIDYPLQYPPVRSTPQQRKEFGYVSHFNTGIAVREITTPCEAVVTFRVELEGVDRASVQVEERCVVGPHLT